jgi:hypothetical protein
VEREKSQTEVSAFPSAIVPVVGLCCVVDDAVFVVMSMGEASGG